MRDELVELARRAVEAARRKEAMNEVVESNHV